jgi:hypothetical protein
MKTTHNPRSDREVRLHVHRRDTADAFIPDPEGRQAHADDTLAENLAEVFLESATSGEEQAEEKMNELVLEELGGPFVEDTLVEDIVPEFPAPERARRLKH